MSLQDIYNAQFGGGAAEQGTNDGAEKTAEEKQMDELLEKFDEAELGKLAAAGELLDSFGMEYESGPEKLASACNLVDFLSVDDGEEEGETKEASTEGDDSEKLAAEYYAAGGIFAKGFVDAISSGEEADGEKVAEDAAGPLLSKLRQ
jgi:hypothetical protein